MKRFLLLLLPVALHAGVTYSDNSGAAAINEPGDYTLSYNSGAVVSGTLNGANGTRTTRTFGANINDGIVSLSMAMLAERDSGGGNPIANGNQSFSFSDTLFVQSSGSVTMTLTPFVSISPSGGANTGWTSAVIFGLNSDATTFVASQSTEDLRTNTTTTFSASPITLTFNPSGETNQTGTFNLTYSHLFSQNAWAQVKGPDTSNAFNLDLQFYLRITDITPGALVSSASGTDYTMSAVPEPASLAALAGLMGLTLAATRRRRRLEA